MVPGLGLRLGLAARVRVQSQKHQDRCLDEGSSCRVQGGCAPPAGWHLHHLALGVEVGGVPFRLRQIGHWVPLTRHDACRVTEQ